MENLRQLSTEEIDDISDFYERAAAQLFNGHGLQVYEAPMIIAPRENGNNKKRCLKRATVPDMVVQDGQIFRFVEISRSDVHKNPRKRHQRGVMARAGLAEVYVQLGGQEMESLLCTADEAKLLEKIIKFLRLR